MDTRKEYSFEEILCPIPASRSEWVEWRRQAKAWRRKKTEGLSYTGKNFDDSSAEWIRSRFLLVHLQLNDTNFLDQKTNEYDLEKFIEKGRNDFGGYDYLFYWPGYINLGCDDRNQWDYWRDHPGGLSGLRAVTQSAQAKGIRIAIGYYPWDDGTRREETPDEDMIINMMSAMDTDAVFLDTGKGGSVTLQKKLDNCKPGCVIQMEHEPRLEDLSFIRAGLYVNQGSIPLGLLRNKWFERRYTTQILKKNSESSQNIVDNIHNAFFNGVGIEIQENCFSAPNLIDYRSRSLLRAMLPIQRRYCYLFTNNADEDSWIPAVETNSDHLAGSLWQNGSIRLWTLCNLSQRGISGSLLSVPHIDGNSYYDLISGCEMHPVFENGSAVLSFRVAGKGIMGIVAANQADLGEDFPEFLRSQAEVDSRADFSLDVPDNPEILEPVAPTQLYDRNPEGMAGFTQVKAYYMGILCRNREPALRPYYQTPLHRFVDLSPFAIDIEPVTNAHFKEFLDTTGYAPSNRDNFLKHWVDGSPAAGTEMSPVVYVSHEDALAYAAWLGKRLPTEEEYQYANTMGVLKFGTYRVWNWTASIRHDSQSRIIILKGGTDFSTTTPGGKWPQYAWYPDNANWPGAELINDPRWTTAFHLSAAGINRQGTIGFRCVTDKSI